MKYNIYYCLSESYLDNKQIDEAAKYLKKFMSDRPFDSQTYRLRGKIAWLENKDLQAKDYLIKASEIDPNSTAYKELVYVYLKEKNYNEALDCVEKLIIVEPDGSVHKFYRGLLGKMN